MWCLEIIYEWCLALYLPTRDIHLKPEKPEPPCEVKIHIPNNQGYEEEDFLLL